MVDEQVIANGVRDPLMLAAMRKVKRECFVPPDLADMAYRDMPLSIGYGQTISQPYMVALMVASLRLKGGERVLDIGTGSGYAAAVLAEISGRVVTIERIKGLADRARKVLAKLEYPNITIITGDGTKGCAEFAPYDAILVNAGGPVVPHLLSSQLKIDGRMVVPVGPEKTCQTLVRVTRHSKEEFSEENLCEVRFVPLVGEEGWQ